MTRNRTGARPRAARSAPRTPSKRRCFVGRLLRRTRPHALTAAAGRLAPIQAAVFSCSKRAATPLATRVFRRHRAHHRRRPRAPSPPAAPTGCARCSASWRNYATRGRQGLRENQARRGAGGVGAVCRHDGPRGKNAFRPNRSRNVPDALWADRPRCRPLSSCGRRRRRKNRPRKLSKMAGRRGRGVHRLARPSHRERQVATGSPPSPPARLPVAALDRPA